MLPKQVKPWHVAVGYVLTILTVPVAIVLGCLYSLLGYPFVYGIVRVTDFLEAQVKKQSFGLERDGQDYRVVQKPKFVNRVKA